MPQARKLKDARIAWYVWESSREEMENTEQLLIGILKPLWNYKYIPQEFRTSQTNRLAIPDLGDYFNDMLRLEAILHSRSIAQEVAHLLKLKLTEQQEERTTKIGYLARKRGLDVETMTRKLLAAENLKGVINT